MTASELETILDQAWESREEITSGTTGSVRDAVEEAIDGLDNGNFRVAEKDASGIWTVNQWLKKSSPIVI